MTKGIFGGMFDFDGDGRLNAMEQGLEFQFFHDVILGREAEETEDAKASLALTTAIIEVPFLANMFDFAHLDAKAYGISIGLAFLVIPIVEIIKAVQRAMAKKK